MQDPLALWPPMHLELQNQVAERLRAAGHLMSQHPILRFGAEGWCHMHTLSAARDGHDRWPCDVLRAHAAGDTPALRLSDLRVEGALSRAALAGLASGLPTLAPLRRLCLADCSLDTDSMALLRRAAQDCPLLETLGLSGNRVGDVGVDDALAIAAAVPSLRSLDLSRNDLAAEPPPPPQVFQPRALRLASAPLRGGNGGGGAAAARRWPSEAWLRARFAARHMRLTIEAYIGVVVLARLGPRLIGLSGVPPWALAPALVLVSAYSHADRHLWWFAHQNPKLGNAAPLLAAALAAVAAAAAAVTALMQDSTWHDGSASGHAASLRFANRNAAVAAAATFGSIGILCTRAQHRALVALRPRASLRARARAAAACVSALYPYIEHGAVVGTVPAAVAWLTVGDVLVAARDEVMRLLEQGGGLLGLPMDAFLPVHGWVVHVVWAGTMVRPCADACWTAQLCLSCNAGVE